MKPRIVAELLELKGDPVRLVAWDWRKDEDYVNAEGILDAYQVTWSSSRDPLRGWLGNVDLHDNGTWTAGDDLSVRYSSPEAAAQRILLDWLAYEEGLSDEDYEKLAGKIVSAVALPGARPPPPTHLNRLKRKLLRG